MRNVTNIRILLAFIGALSFSSIFSQNIIPNGFSLQAIARDINGNVAPNRVVYLQVEIIRDTVNPVIVYTEIHQTTTTAEGIFNITIGNGQQTNGTFSAIKWVDAPYSLNLKVAITPSNPSTSWNYQQSFIDAGTIPILSVPYAKVAGNGLDSTKVFFLRDTTSILGRYLRIDSLPQYLNNKLNISDSLVAYVTPSQLKSVGYDTSQMLSGYIRKNNAITGLAIDTANGVSGVASTTGQGSITLLSFSLGNIRPVSVNSPFGKFDTLIAKVVRSDSISGALTTPNQPNITTVGTLNGLNVTGLVSADMLSGTLSPGTLNGILNNITSLGNLSSLTVTGTTNINQLTVTNNITASTLSATITTPVQPNITSIGILNGLTVTGTVSAVTLSGTLSPGTLNGILNNITSLGNLSSLTVTGTINLNQLTVTNNITASTLSATITTPEQPNITSIGILNGLTVTGTVSAGVLSGTLSAGATNNITSLGNLSSLTVTGTTNLNQLTVTNNITASTLGGIITTPSQPNIATVGVLTNLSVTGTVASNSISTSSAVINSITGLNLLQGSNTDSIVTISGGVLRKLVYVPQVDTFTNNFVVNGVPNYLKWVNGDTVPAMGKTALQLLMEGATKSIAPTYISPTISISALPSGGNIEIGSSLNVRLSSNFTQNDAGAVITTTYNKNGSSLGSNTDNVSNITSPLQYSVSVAYGQGICKNDNLGVQNCNGRIVAGAITSSSITYTPVPARYWGYAGSTSPSDADLISSLGGGFELSNSKAKSSFTINIPGINSYIFFAYPSSLGTLSSITVGGFESIGTFTLTTRTVVNASGYSQSYNVYVSNNNFSIPVSGIITN